MTIDNVSAQLDTLTTTDLGARLDVLNAQRRQALATRVRMSGEIAELRRRLETEASQEVQKRLEEVKRVREWAGEKWRLLEGEIGDVFAELAVRWFRRREGGGKVMGRRRDSRERGEGIFSGGLRDICDEMIL